MKARSSFRRGWNVTALVASLVLGHIRVGYPQSIPSPPALTPVPITPTLQDCQQIFTRDLEALKQWQTQTQATSSSTANLWAQNQLTDQTTRLWQAQSDQIYANNAECRRRAGTITSASTETNPILSPFAKDAGGAWLSQLSSFPSSSWSSFSTSWPNATSVATAAAKIYAAVERIQTIQNAVTLGTQMLTNIFVGDSDGRPPGTQLSAMLPLLNGSPVGALGHISPLSGFMTKFAITLATDIASQGLSDLQREMALFDANIKTDNAATAIATIEQGVRLSTTQQPIDWVPTEEATVGADLDKVAIAMEDLAAKVAQEIARERWSAQARRLAEKQQLSKKTDTSVPARAVNTVPNTTAASRSSRDERYCANLREKIQLELAGAAEGLEGDSITANLLREDYDLSCR